MPKKMKINIESLKVQSFVTSLDEKNQQELKGGAISVHWVICMEESIPGYCHTAQCTPYCHLNTDTEC